MWYFIFMKEFRFNNDHTSAEVADIVDVLRQPRLWIPTEKDYPDHGSWLDKTEDLIISGKKRAMAAYMGQDAVGTVIYQRDPKETTSLEIRNISVSDDARGRYVGSFLLRNAEIEAALNDFPGIVRYVVDTKASNVEMIAFLESQGYSIQDITDLYSLDAGLDVVMSKPINK
jgi:ribosomal protein S18 acetylase RimI-like enzyme